MDEMCAYLDEHWNAKSALTLAAYSMWRLNWIHPFFGGNGRSARALSYLVLCAKLGFALPGQKPIPELIMDDRTPYFEALREADRHFEQSRVIDVSRMEALLDSLLAKQLVAIHHSATGSAQDIPAEPEL
jgi:Fic family protein